MNIKDVSCKKIYDYIRIKIQQILYERTFYGDKNEIRHLFYPNKSSSQLIVVFSSLTRKNISARYNYVRTLHDFEINKLFILDDLGPEHRGCYCLGKNRDYSIEKDTQKLINEIKESYAIKHTIYAGSSKGGYCALNFGIVDVSSNIIVGAPQYLLGNYFVLHPDIRLDNWLWGESYTDEDIETLNKRLSFKIENNAINNNCVYLHFSDSEHTYIDHVCFLIDDLNKYKVKVNVDIAHYKNHNDIVNCFPKYLFNTVTEILKNGNK